MDFDVARERLVPIYLGGGIGERAALPVGALMGRAPPRNGVVLFVSSLFAHKNADHLIRAYARLEAAPPLVLIGKDVDGARARLERLAADLGVQKRVSFLGQVSDDVLLEWYRRARVLVYPSSVEGFGLPLAEAMWLGVPIIASNRTSVPEVAGDAALIVDPDDIDSLAQAIREVVTNEELWRSLVARGLLRRGLFSWRLTASRTVEVLLDAARRS